MKKCGSFDQANCVRTKYDAFEHLRAALFWEPQDLVAVIVPDISAPVLYCDASRSANDRYTVVAGAVASVQQWAEFNASWGAALKDNNLKYFRMSEFAHSTGQFERGWKKNEARRRGLLERLVRIIVGHVQCWIGVGVAQREYQAADRKYQLREYLRPYPLCGLTCVELAHGWKAWQHHLDDVPMEYIFEDGDEHQDQLRKAIKEEFGKEPLFRKKLPDEQTPNDRPLTPLQVGDFAAYEVGKFFGTVDQTEELWQRFRTSFALLGNVGPPKWGDLKAEKIQAVLNVRGIPKRTTS